MPNPLRACLPLLCREEGSLVGWGWDCPLETEGDCLKTLGVKDRQGAFSSLCTGHAVLLCGLDIGLAQGFPVVTL